jgi:hypothetical protein
MVELELKHRFSGSKFRSSFSICYSHCFFFFFASETHMMFLDVDSYGRRTLCDWSLL